MTSGVTVDKNGNIYVIGYTTIGIGKQTQHGYLDYFITKYNVGESTPSWTKQVGANTGISKITTANGVAVDKNGNIYVVGDTTDSINGQPQHGTQDYFITKYAAGESTPLWIRQIDANYQIASATGVAVDKDGNIYVVGKTNVGINGQLKHGLNDYFITKYTDGESTPSWINQVGGNNGTTTATGVTVGKDGNIYVAGYTNVAINGQTQYGKEDYFITKYNVGESSPSWTNQVGETTGN